MEQVLKKPAQKHPSKFGLKAFGIDYFFFENPKALQQRYQIKLLGTENVPINFNVNVGVVFIDTEKLIQHQVTIKIQTPGNDKRSLLLVDSLLSYDYWVENYDHYKTPDKQNNFSNDFLRMLANISISTSRGLLSSKLSNTYLQGLVMPLIFQSGDLQPLDAPAPGR